MSFFQCFLYPREHPFHPFVFVSYGEYGVGHLVIDIFLFDPVTLRAVFIMVAVAVPVAFLYLPGYGSAALTALEYSLEERVVLARSRRAITVQSVLDPLEKFFGYERFVISFGYLIFPAVHAVIKRIADELVDSGMTYFVSCPGPQAFFIHHITELLGGILSGGVEIKHFYYERRFLLIRYMDFMPFVADGFITERRFGRKPALGEFFLLAFLYVFGKKPDVVLGRGHFHSPHKPFVGLGVFMQGAVFLYQMDFVVLIGQYPVINNWHIGKVARQPICCFHEDGFDFRFGNMRHHFVEYLALDFSSG